MGIYYIWSESVKKGEDIIKKIQVIALRKSGGKECGKEKQDALSYFQILTDKDFPRQDSTVPYVNIIAT